MTGAIAFALFGHDPKYSVGAIKNAELALKVYPDWKAIFYVDTDIPKAVVDTLVKLRAEVRPPVEGIANGMFWRFCISDDPAYKRFLSRDVDSRLNAREKGAVDQWIASGLQWHMMGDHPHHIQPLMAGLFGGTSGLIPNMKNLVIKSGLAKRKYDPANSYDLDQYFLANFVYPTAKKSLLRHDSCNRHLFRDSLPFPDGQRFAQERFVGEIIDAHDQPHPWHWQQRLNFLTP